MRIHSERLSCGAVPPRSVPFARCARLDPLHSVPGRPGARIGDRSGAHADRGRAHDGRGEPGALGAASPDAPLPPSHRVRRADAIPRVLRGPRAAREPRYHADEYPSTSCGGGGAVSLSPTSGGTPTTVFVSAPLRRISRRCILPLPYVIWNRSTSDL